MLRSAMLLSWVTVISSCSSRLWDLDPERPHPAVEVGGSTFCVADREIDRVASRGARELDSRGQQDRLAEANLDAEGVGQAALQRRQAAGLGPHAVGDRPREAERLGGQRVHVDRVAVAGDGRVAAAEVVAELPLGARRQVVARRRVRLPAAARLVAAAAQHRADALPDELAADARLGDEAEGPPARVRLERGRPHSQVSSSSAGRSAAAARSGSRRGPARPRRRGSCRRPSPPCAAGRRARAGRWGGGGRVGRSRRRGSRRRPLAGSARTPVSSSSISGISLPRPGMKGSSEAPGIIGAAARA